MAEGVAPRQVAYLAQQAAEKALKATIALEGSRATPDARPDLPHREMPAGGVRQVDIDIAALSAAQTAARYPDPEDLPYDRDEAELLVTDATRSWRPWGTTSIDVASPART